MTMTSLWNAGRILALGFVVSLLGIVGVSAYSISFNDAMSLNIDGREIKLFMGQDNNNFYLDATDISGLPLSCEIKAGTSLLVQRTNCNDISFSYNGSMSDIKIYVQTDNDQGTWTYNKNDRRFTDARRGDTDIIDDNNYNNNYGSIQITTNDTYPSLYEYLNLTVRVLDSNGYTDTDFQGEVRFTVSKRDNNGSYYTASTNDYWLSNSRYNFSYSDNGYRSLSNYVQFNNAGTYKIRVENTQNGRTAEVTVYVDTTCTGSCNNNNNNTTTSFLVESSTPFPTTNQYLNTTITARTNNYDRDYNYQGTVRFVVEKRDTNGSYRYTASSSDYTLSNTTTYLYSSDQGYKNISSHLRFYNNGNYRLKVVDDFNSSIVGYKEFTVGGGSSSSQNRSLAIDVSSTNPSTSQYINTTTTVKDQYGNRDYNYQGTIRYIVEERDNNSSYRSTASSSDYTLSNTTTYLYSSDQGYKNISFHVRFNNNGIYRIKVIDDNNSNVYGYSSTITIGSNSSNSSNGFELATNNTTPGENNFVNLTITAKNTNGYTNTNYSNLVRFKVYRRMSSSYDWNEITTSSLDNSAYRIFNSSYNFSSSYNNGSVTISNFIKFYSDDYDYKVRVVDDTNSNIYGEIIYYLKNSQNGNNNNSTTDAYRFVATLYPNIPTLNSRFDVTVTAKNSSNGTVTNYSRRVNFTIEKKISASSTRWTTASTTYCKLSQNSYTFSYNDNGQRSLSDLVRCSRTGFYRIKMTDSANSSVLGYTYFTIPSSISMASTIPGFTTTQRDEIRNIYKNFMYELNNRQTNYPRLAYNTSWNTSWTNYYKKLYATVYKRTGRFTSYSSYLNAAANFNSDLNNMR